MTAHSLNRGTGIECVCESCEKRFRLSADDDDTETSTHLKLCGCESGGVYVVCPYCKWEHELY